MYSPAFLNISSLFAFASIFNFPVSLSIIATDPLPLAEYSLPLTDTFVIAFKYALKFSSDTPSAAFNATFSSS